MAKKLTVEITEDEAAALAVIRPFAREIARAARAAEKRFPGFGLMGAWLADDLSSMDPKVRTWKWPGYLASIVEMLGDAALWSPFFWKLLSLERAAASKDPTQFSRALARALGGNVAETAALRKRLAASSDEAREELRLLWIALRGRRGAGRPEGTRKVDHVERKRRVFRKADEIDRHSGGRERAPLKKAIEALAATIQPGKALRPSTLKRSLSRAGK